jgi:hypothetical protein
MLSFLGLLIAYIVVKIVVEPSIDWLNTLLLTLSLLSLATSIFNLVLCGMPATGYAEKKGIQIICFIVTLFTGGIISSTLTGLGAFIKVEDDEIQNEKIFNTKTFKNKDGKLNDKNRK